MDDSQVGRYLSLVQALVKTGNNWPSIALLGGGDLG